MRCKVYAVLAAGGPALALLLAACATGPEDDETASGIPWVVVRTDQSATLRHADGWEVQVPAGAVPNDRADGTGEMLFSIEPGALASFAMPSAPPPGWTMATDPVDLGPSWMTLAMPVTTSLPLPRSVNLDAVDACLFAYEGRAARWVARGGAGSTGRLRADILWLGPHVLMTRPLSAEGWGALAFDAIPGHRFVVSIQEAHLGYFPEDAAFDPAWWHVRIPSLEELDSAEGRSYAPIPQGIYRLSLGVYHGAEGVYLGYGETTVTVAQSHDDMTGPDHTAYANAVSVGDLAWWTDPSHLSPGAQPGVPPPTPSAGIGAVNVRLEWTAAADLDLWIVDPCGNRLYDGAPTAVCGDAVGTLDMENQCARLIAGKPENAFWTTPARGVYTVYVDYYADCGGAGRIPYTLRWMSRGAVHALHGMLLPPEWTGVVGDEVKLAEFRY